MSGESAHQGEGTGIQATGEFGVFIFLGSEALLFGGLILTYVVARLHHHEAFVGGSAELSTLEAAYVRRLSEAETVARLLAADLAARGLFTPKGRVRNTFQRWTEAINLWDRLAQRVGVDRRSRPVLSLQDYMAQAQEQRPEEHGMTFSSPNLPEGFT